MLTQLSTIGERLKWLRTKNSISQEEMAHIMCVSRVTYIQTENGLRSPRNDELQRIAENFELSLSDISEQNLPKVNHEVHSRENDPNYKFKHALLYILSRCGQKPNIGKTILNKLLYFADFNFYERNGENSITNAIYVKMPF
jgi:transcriptional regulator with XRE-family HTH domain